MREDRQADAGRSQVESPRAAREFANFCLVESGVKQRRDHTEFGGGAVAGPEILQIIRVEAISDSRRNRAARNFLQHSKQFGLAVIAAVGLIQHIKRIVEFMRGDEFMPQIHFARESLRLPLDRSAEKLADSAVTASARGPSVWCAIQAR